jgi:hypothetical protein
MSIGLLHNIIRFLKINQESHSTFADNVVDWENKALLLAFEVIQDWMDLDRQSNENYTV